MKLIKAIATGNNLVEANDFDETRSFNRRRAEAGTVKFLKSTLTDPHIKDAIDFIAKAQGTTPDQIVGALQHQVKERQEYSAKSPLLYETISHNIVENEVFNMFWEIDPSIRVSGAPKFSNIDFNNLVNDIQAERMGNFFPLRGQYDKRVLKRPDIHYNQQVGNTPHPDDNPKHHGVTTAAASSQGWFVFNKPFMQKLIDWAYLKKVKPKGKKYKSNGGNIPDEYCYIEFVIMHEFLHFTNDDFHFSRVNSGLNPTIANWAGDFIINYMLVKSGYEQLPMGLFNDKINLDRQEGFTQIYNLINSEFNRLSQEDKNKIKQDLDNQMDDHNQDPDAGSGEPTGGSDGKSQEGGTFNVGDEVMCPNGKIGRVTAVNGKKIDVEWSD